MRDLIPNECIDIHTVPVKHTAEASSAHQKTILKFLWKNFKKGGTIWKIIIANIYGVFPLHGAAKPKQPTKQKTPRKQRR